MIKTPIEKLVFIIFCVVAAAGATIWAGVLLTTSMMFNPLIGLLVLSVLALAVYVIWRVIADRVNNAEDDHYDRIEK